MQGHSISNISLRVSCVYGSRIVNAISAVAFEKTTSPVL